MPPTLTDVKMSNYNPPLLPRTLKLDVNKPSFEKQIFLVLWVAKRGSCTGRVMCEVFKVLTAEKEKKKSYNKMLIFVACIDVIITLITLILLLFINEIIIPINVILMMMIINACYRLDQWFTHCLSITLQHEINYSLRKKEGVICKWC